MVLLQQKDILVACEPHFQTVRCGEIKMTGCKFEQKMYTYVLRWAMHLMQA